MKPSRKFKNLSSERRSRTAFIFSSISSKGSADSISEHRNGHTVWNEYFRLGEGQEVPPRSFFYFFWNVTIARLQKCVVNLHFILPYFSPPRFILLWQHEVSTVWIIFNPPLIEPAHVIESVCNGQRFHQVGGLQTTRTNLEFKKGLRKSFPFWSFGHACNMASFLLGRSGRFWSPAQDVPSKTMEGRKR